MTFPFAEIGISVAAETLHAGFGTFAWSAAQQDTKSEFFGFISMQFTSQEILLNHTFRQSAPVFFSGWEYSVWVWEL